MSNEIKLSKKYGVNPTLCTCFFCGAHKGIAMLGQIDKADSEAPKECIMDYEPCDKCQENMSLGVTIIEVSDQRPLDNRPPMKAQGGVEVYPLGRWCVLSEECQLCVDNDIKKGGSIFVDTEVMNLILNQ